MKSKLIALAVFTCLIIPCLAQVKTGGLDVRGAFSGASASSTEPNRSGTGSPNGRDSCAAIGETYFQRDAAAGSNTWACTVTGNPGTWAVQGAGGVGTSSPGQGLFNDSGSVGGFSLLFTAYTPVGFSTTPAFPLTSSTVQTFKLMLQSPGVTSSTTSGTPNAGQVLIMRICEPGGGNLPFVYPTNFVGADAVDQASNACTTQGFVYNDVTGNWEAWTSGKSDSSTPGWCTSTGCYLLPAAPDTLVGIAAAQTLTSKILTNPSLGANASALTSTIPNASSTGTTLKKLAKFTGAPSTAVIASTSDTSGMIGVVIAGAGTTGNAEIARTGTATCAFDAATTAGHYVQISASVAGDCHDAGASLPATGQVLGMVTETIGSAGDAKLFIRLADSAGLGDPGSNGIVKRTSQGITTTASAGADFQAVIPYTTEDAANKSTNTALGTSDTLYPSQAAVKSYVDAHSGGGGTGVGRKPLTATWTAIPDGGCQDQTATWTGVTTADTVAVGAPSTLATGLTVPVGWVSATDTVKIRYCNTSGGPITPGSQTLNATLAIYNLSGSSTIDFSSIPDGGCAPNTFTLTGVAAGDPVIPKWPAALESGLVPSGMVATATNTVQVRLCNFSGGALDPASASFGASVAK